MFYREIGQFKTSYAADQAVAPLREDQWLLLATIVFAICVPWLVREYWLSAILTPTLVLGLAALGTNLLTGYAGQLSLGTAAFMSIGGFAAYNILMRLPAIPFPIGILAAGLITAAFGALVGLPALRLKGFYLLVGTLFAHFFVGWFFDQYQWFQNYSATGQINPPPLTMFGNVLNSPMELYYVTLSFVVPLTFAAKNMMRSTLGRNMMAVRDMDVAASVIGISTAKTKIMAFSISAFYSGVAGALYVYCYMQLLSTSSFGLDVAFSAVFIIIVGGLGTVLGSYLGAVVIFCGPIFLNQILGNYGFGAADVSNLSKIMFGTLVIAILILEPNGLMRLFGRLKEKIRAWPFPY